MNILNVLNIFLLEVAVNGNKPPEYMSEEDDADQADAQNDVQDTQDDAQDDAQDDVQEYSRKSKSKKERFLTEMEGGDHFVVEYEDEDAAKTKKKKKKKKRI